MKGNYFYGSIFFIVFFSVTNYSQETATNFWVKSGEVEIEQSKQIIRRTLPKNYQIFNLNLGGLKSVLKNVPNSKSDFILSFPNSKGEMERFSIWEASFFSNALQEKFPDIRSYKGSGIDDPTASIRISISKMGLHAMVLSGVKSPLFIDPYSIDKLNYIIYSKKDLPNTSGFKCLVEDSGAKLIEKPINSNKILNANDGNLRTFKLAVATTGEYSQIHLTGSEANDTERRATVLAAITVTMNRVNGIFERDLSLTMELVDNTSIIYLFGNTDPFTNDDVNALINESQAVIDAQIGSLNYDIGHTFSTVGGGLSIQNSPCVEGDKASAVTGSPTPIGDAYDVDFVAHEMGHQFGASHTFNGDAGACGDGTINIDTAVEPGSGSTIMAYTGICAPQNVQLYSDSYFHSVSIQEIWANISSGVSTCASLIDTTNDNAPTVNAGDDYTIPKSTPFELTGIGGDLDGDAITYCWEQTDTGLNPVPLLSTSVVGPTFRSFAPTISPIRVFPELNRLLNGYISSGWEVIPSVTRTLNFDLTVRDNNATGGQSAKDNMVVSIDGAKGPFEVTSQNTSGITWVHGTSETITWNVNASNLLSGASNVNILLSTDGGQTFPTVLAASTANDGSEVITVPNIPAAYCRVLVQPTNNIFFSINVVDFSIDYTIEVFCKTFTAPQNRVIEDGGLMIIGGDSPIDYNVIITDVNVNVDITHTAIGDLEIKLESPAGTEIDLYEFNCTIEDDMLVTFDDAGTIFNCESTTSGVYYPYELLSSLNGESSSGDWLFKIADAEVGDVGVLNSYEIEICSTVETPLSVNQFAFKEFSIYPNPSEGIVHLNLLSNSSSSVNISIYDVLGRLISSEKHESFGSEFNKEINLENLAAGSYILKVERGDKTSSKRLLIY